MQNFAIAFILLLVWPPSALSAERSPSQFIYCKLHKQVRTIRLVPSTTEKPCNTIYTKQGKDRVIGTGQMNHSCVKFLENVKGNLAEAGWKCEDASASSRFILSPLVDIESEASTTL